MHKSPLERKSGKHFSRRLLVYSNSMTLANFNLLDNHIGLPLPGQEGNF